MLLEINSYNDIVAVLIEDLNIRKIQKNNKINLELEKLVTIKKENMIKYLNNIFNQYNFSSLSLNIEQLKKLENELSNIEYIFCKFFAKENSFSEDIKNHFVKFLILNLYFHRIVLNNIYDISIYIETSKKLLDKMEENFNNLKLLDKNLLNLLRRYLYLLLHDVKFDYKKEVYEECIKYIEKDIKYSKSLSLREYILSITNYLDITVDHLFFNSEEKDSYIDNKIFNFYKQELIQNISEYIKNKQNEKAIVLKSISAFFKIELLNVRKELKNSELEKEKEEDYKKKLFIKSKELIKAFLENDFNLAIFLTSDGDYYNISFSDALKEFSYYLSLILNNISSSYIGILFLLFKLFSNFKEYTKLNQHIFTRLSFILQNHYYNKKLYLITKILNAKTIRDMSQFKNEMISIKKEIEKNPLISLINFYNNELENILFIDTQLKNILRISPSVIKINEKINSINKIIFNSIITYKNEYYNTSHYKIKIEYLFNFQNEIKNIFTLASDPYLLQDFARFYGEFIDSYIKKEGLDYREDFITKSIFVKMAILDMNPLTFFIALLYSKIGKLNLILNSDEPYKLGIKKKSLTNLEKDKIATFFQYSYNYFPKNDDSFNWNYINEIILNIRNPAISEEGKISYIESRILKVISAFINKLTRQDVEISHIFRILYDESYVYAKREWDLDPLIIFYLNYYLTKRGKIIFYNENTGEKLELIFPYQKNSIIYEKIYSFIKDLINKTLLPQNNILQDMQSLTEGNDESLINGNGNFKNIAFLDVQKFIKLNKSLYLEKNFINLKDKIYLFGILSHYLTVMNKSKLISTFVYIITQIINNANKANLKRVYYNSKKLDINQKYHLAINDFFSTLNLKLEELIEMLKKTDYKIKFMFQIVNDNLIISVINNYKIHEAEIDLINECLLRAKTLNNLKDIYKLPIKTKEGDGLGLIIVFLFLKKMGLGREYFKVNIEENKTTVKIIIPFIMVTKEEEERIAEELVKEIDSIPMIPENINRLKSLLKNKEANIDEIESEIIKDPSLSADILRMANSSFYRRMTKITTIKEGIKVLGFNAIANLILISHSYKLLKNKVSEKRIEEIIMHSEMTAFFTKELTKLKNITLNADDMYLASLLHDMGKIVVEGINPNIYEKIQKTIEEKDIPIDVIEDLSGGLNHSLTGSLLAKKWNFPDIICEVIRCHHNPRLAEINPEAVFIVYLADILTYYNFRKILYENIDQNVLEFLELKNREDFEKIAKNLHELWLKNKEEEK